MTNILLIEDDNGIQKMLSISLGAAGYELVKANSIKSGLVALSQNPVSLVLLDLGLPDGDGKKFIQEAKIFSDVPIIVISARDIESEKIEALELGADDYLTKPFSIGELIARIKALSRRVKDKDESQESEIKIGKLIINLTNKTLTVDSKPIKLTKKEFDLALLFFRHLGQPLSRATLLETLWTQDADTPSRTVDTHVSRVRSKLGLHPTSGFRLVPVYGYGYLLERVGE